TPTSARSFANKMRGNGGPSAERWSLRLDRPPPARTRRSFRARDAGEPDAAASTGDSSARRRWPRPRRAPRHRLDRRAEAVLFRSALGATNRPFAAPGDFVEVAVDQARCDTGSPGFAADGADHVVTIVFKPTGGQARVVFLTAGSCGGGPITSAQLACEGTVG